MAGPAKNFEMRVRKYLESKGAYVLKYVGGSQTKKGVPDLLVCYKGKFIALEMKAPKGNDTGELQNKNIDWIREAGGYARFLFPQDFDTFKKELEDL